MCPAACKACNWMVASLTAGNCSSCAAHTRALEAARHLRQTASRLSRSPKHAGATRERNAGRGQLLWQLMLAPAQSCQGVQQGCPSARGHRPRPAVLCQDLSRQNGPEAGSTALARLHGSCHARKPPARSAAVSLSDSTCSDSVVSVGMINRHCSMSAGLPVKQRLHAGYRCDPTMHVGRLCAAHQVSAPDLVSSCRAGVSSICALCCRLQTAHSCLPCGWRELQQQLQNVRSSTGVARSDLTPACTQGPKVYSWPQQRAAHQRSVAKENAALSGHAALNNSSSQGSWTGCSKALGAL